MSSYNNNSKAKARAILTDNLLKNIPLKNVDSVYQY